MEPHDDYAALTFRMDRGLRDELAEAARRHDRSLAAELRQAIRAHIAQERAATPSSSSGTTRTVEGSTA